jgi:hypothetical protein
MVYTTVGRVGEAELNARLIAAAPDMYAALERSLDAAERVNEPLGFERAMAAKRATQAALAKARGETRD